MNPRLAAGGALVLGVLGVYFLTGGGSGAQLGRSVGPCGVSITSPARARDGKVTLRSGQSLTVALAGTATRCPGSTLTRRFNDGGSSTITVGADGTWSDSATVADGVTTSLTVSSPDAGAALIIDARTAAPRVQVTAPTRDDWDTWHLVASKVDAGCGGGGNINAERFALSGFINDIDCADGGQVRPSVTVTGAAGGWLSVTWNGAPLVDAGVVGSPATLTEAQLGTLTLPDLSMGELAFTATTSGGVATSLTTYATVRTLTPPALVGPDGGAAELTVLDPRRASVRVSYVVPHVPVEIGAAHTEFAWTTGSVPCGTGGTARDSCYSAADGDAGFFSVVQIGGSNVGAVCGTVAVPEGSCAYGSELIWLKLDGGYTRVSTPQYPTGMAPESGDRLGVAAFSRSSTCAGTVSAINPRGPCVSSVQRPPANAVTMTDGGGSTRDYWDEFYTPNGLARVFLAAPVFDPGVPLYPSNGASPSGYLEMRRELQDCRLYDAEASPQVWRCIDGATVYEGQVRHGVVASLPPINLYVILPVLVW